MIPSASSTSRDTPLCMPRSTESTTVSCVPAFLDIDLNTNYDTTINFADEPQLRRVGWMMANMLQSITTQQVAAFQPGTWDVVEGNEDGFAVRGKRIYPSTSNSRKTHATRVGASQAVRSAERQAKASLGLLYVTI
jgi:hypothetical protein